MDILYLLVPLSLVLVFVIAVVFWWNLKSGQFEDLEGPGYRILMDDDRPDRMADVRARDVRPTEGGGDPSEEILGSVDPDQSARPGK